MWWSEWWNFLTHSHLHSPCSLRRIQSLYLGAKWKLGGLTTPNSPPLTACSNQAEKIGIFSRDLFSHFWRWLPLGLPDESWLVNFPLGVVLDFIQMAQRTPVYAYPSPKTHATKLHLIPQAWNTPLLGYYVTMWHLFPLPTICWIVGFVDFISHKIFAYNVWLCNCPCISGPNPDHLICRYVGMSDGEKSPAMLLLIPQTWNKGTSWSLFPYVS